MITVALPAFKGRYLADALRSLLAQEFGDFELVVVDDASPDPIGEIVRGFEDPRIRYVRNETNLGGRCLVDNWNKCLGLASREWFVLASDDDLYEPGFLREMVELAGRYPDVDVFHSRVAVIDGQDRLTDLTPGCPEYETAEDFLWHRLKLGRAAYIPEFMFRTRALRDAGGFVDFPAAWGSDVATCVRVAERGGFGYCNEPLVRWRRSGLNISTSSRYLAQKLSGLEGFVSWCRGFLAGKESDQARLALQCIESFRERRLGDLLSGCSTTSLVSRLVLPKDGFSRSVVCRALAKNLKSSLGAR